jgi:serine protease
VPIRPVHLLRFGVPAALVAATLVTVTGSSGTAAQQSKLYVVKPTFARVADEAKPTYAPNSVLVKFKKSASSSARSKALGKVQNRSTDSVTSDVVTVTGDQAAPDLLKKLKADPSVELASLDYIRSISATPNDTYYGSDQAGYLGAIRMPQAWDLSKTSGAQTVAVLDTGIDAGHPDLVGHTLPGRNEIQPGTTPNDNNGHGTMTAGIIGASTNNGVGISGVAWNAKLLPVKVLDSSGSGPDSVIIKGINWAAANGAKVINMSLGGDQDDPLLHDAIKAAVNKGIVVVVAAGNTGANAPHYPAAYPEVIAVAATDNNGALTSFSTQGDWVDIAAPGWNILSTGPRSLTPAGYLPYWSNSGTSFSAPMVAGVAALLRNKFPTYTPAQIAARLKSTARDAGPHGLDPFYGAGVLDAFGALGGSWAADFWSAGPDGNDVPARATALAGSATGTIGPEGDVDWYKINSATARTVTINVKSPTYDWQNRAQNFAPVVAAFDKDLNPLGSQTIATEPQTPATVTASVHANLVAGDNYVKVRNYNGSRDSRAYTISFGGSQPVATPLLHAWVTNSSLQAYSTNVALTAKPVITFARDLSPASVIESTVQLINGKTGAAVPSTVEYAADTKQVTISPTNPLQDNTPYRISIGDVQDTDGTTFPDGFTSVFRTVDQAPGPLAAFDATGGYTTAALSWTLPGITDLDQVIVRGAAGTTPPDSPAAGIAMAPGATTSGTATGLANATSYAFSAWVKDRSGKLSATPLTTQLIGTATTLTSNRAIIDFGGSVTLGGKVTRIDTSAPLAGVSIALYGRNKNSATWRTIARRTTAADGTYSLAYSPSVSTVLAWGYDGSADLLGSRTGNYTVEVRPTINANVSPTTIKLGASTNFYGYVRPQHAGSPVYLQRLSGSTWSTITSTKLNTTGNYAFGIKPTAKGTYTYRVVFQADADHATAVSAAKSFTVN